MTLTWQRGVTLVVAILSTTGRDGLVLAQPASQPADDPPSISEAASDGPWMDGVSLEQQENARALFLEGNELIKEAFFGDAAARYQAALALWDHPAFHFNLAMAQRALDQPVLAHASLARAMRYGPAPLGQVKYDYAVRLRALLESQLGQIDVRCDEPGATVTLDGAPLFTGPGQRTVIVTPGNHQLVATKPGHGAETRQIVAAPGERIDVAIAPLRLQRPVEMRRWAVWKPWAVVSAGVAVTLAGGVLHWRARDGFATFDDGFDTMCSRGCTEGGLAGGLVDRLDGARAQRNAAYVTYAVGGATVVTGLILVYLDRARVMTGPVRPRRDTVRVTLMSAPGSAGVTAALSF